MLTVIANVRGSTEFKVANEYTYRQLTHIITAYIKDKFLVVTEIAKALGVDAPEKKKRGSPPPADKNQKKQAASKKRGLPKWYRPAIRFDPAGRRIKQFNRVVDLDSPLQELQPYLGKGKINRRKNRAPTGRK